MRVQVYVDDTDTARLEFRRGFNDPESFRGEPSRGAILRLVRGRELAAGRNARHFDVTRPAVSQHLRVLLDAGLVNERRDGTRRFYSMRPEGFEELELFLNEFWSGSPRRIKFFAEKAQKKKRHRPR